MSERENFDAIHKQRLTMERRLNAILGVSWWWSESDQEWHAIQGSVDWWVSAVRAHNVPAGRVWIAKVTQRDKDCQAVLLGLPSDPKPSAEEALEDVMRQFYLESERLMAILAMRHPTLR